MRVLLVAPNASASMGGEAILPLHWLRELRALGVEAELLTHARCRDELSASSYADMPIHYVEDSGSEIALWRFGKRSAGLTQRLGGFTLSFVSMWRLGQEVRKLHKRTPYDLVHQVTPVSPRLPSPVTMDDAAVVIGPLNGNMSFPPGFAERYGDGSEEAEGRARGASNLLHRLFPGKPEADRVLVSNPRTAEGLPPSVRRNHVATFIENGVDLDLWQEPGAMPDGPPRFIFVGRLVGWKAVDILLEAFASVPEEAHLTICGDGEARPALEELTAELGLEDRVTFMGQVPQHEVVGAVADSHCLVLSSLYECGGAVVLEAMAMRRAVIAPDWGGPADYVTEETGVLVAPTTREGFKTDLAATMTELAGDLPRMRAYGDAGRVRVEEHFAWHKKGEAMLALYRDVLGV